MLGRVAVVGCGLIGGSVIKGLRVRDGAEALLAIDQTAVIEQARAWLDGAAVIDEGEENRTAVARLIASADLVVLATPVSVIAGMLPSVLADAPSAAVVTDCGSVKRPVVECVARHPRRSRFVPGHPMAGRETGGFEAASESLFEGGRWYLVREAAAPDALDRVAQLVHALGASPVETQPDVHDRAMAYVSHLPQLVASALVDLAASAGVLPDAGPGFRDMTRIAGGPSPVWRDIFDANADHLAQAVAEFIQRLEPAREAGAAGRGRASGFGSELESVMSILERARRARRP